MTWKSHRRLFLRGLCVATAGGLAGCSDDSGDADDDEDGTDSPAETTATTTDDTDGTLEAPDTTEDPGQTTTPVANPQERIDDWLSNTGNYDGTIVNWTGQSQNSIAVGADGNGQPGFAFDPPAIRGAVGLTVNWSWTGDGGSHGIIERNGAFDSGALASGSGRTFQHNFEEPGLYLYKCKNHGESIGMRGAILIGEQQTLSGYPAVDDWLQNEDFDGILVDGRNQRRVTIDVGAEGNEGYFAYDPNAVAVSPGTQIYFDWTGFGGSHDIYWQQGDLPDSEPMSSAQATHIITIDEPGVYLYECDSHAPSGGRGAIVVVDE